MSTVELTLGTRSFRVDTSKRFDLSIPLNFSGNQLSAFGIPPARSNPVENDWFVGSTRHGGSCNVEELHLIPHGQGTHTECVGHIVDQAVFINEILTEAWIPAIILTLTPEPAMDSADRYTPDRERRDYVIGKKQMAEGLHRFDDENFHRGLIIRTLPNDLEKKTRCYSTAPYFSNDAMREIVSRPVQHLLVDVPSVDRMDDQGKLSNHRIFWEMYDHAHSLGRHPISAKTITELVFVSDEIEDGYYFLNLQLPPFMSDAAPSRPIVFPVNHG